MKKILLTLLAAVTSFSTFSQVVKNGDFELGTTDDWKIWQSKSNVKITDEDVMSGKYALYVAGGVDQDIRLHKGRYTITAYVRFDYGDPTECEVQLRKRMSLTNYKYTIEEIQTLQLKKQYLPITFNIKVKEESFYKIVFWGKFGSRFKVDNVSISKDR